MLNGTTLMRRQTAGSVSTLGRWLVTMSVVWDGLNVMGDRWRALAVMGSPPVRFFMSAAASLRPFSVSDATMNRLPSSATMAGDAALALFLDVMNRSDSVECA